MVEGNWKDLMHGCYQSIAAVIKQCSTDGIVADWEVGE